MDVWETGNAIHFQRFEFWHPMKRERPVLVGNLPELAHVVAKEIHTRYPHPLNYLDSGHIRRYGSGYGSDGHQVFAVLARPGAVWIGKGALAARDAFHDAIVSIQQAIKDKGYQLIVEKNEGAVLYAEAGSDLTDQVIEKFNSKKKKK